MSQLVPVLKKGQLAVRIWWFSPALPLDYGGHTIHPT